MGVLLIESKLAEMRGREKGRGKVQGMTVRVNRIKWVKGDSFFEIPAIKLTKNEIREYPYHQRNPCPRSRPPTDEKKGEKDSTV